MKRLMIMVLATVIGGQLLMASANAATLYVNGTTGSDENLGTSLEAAKKTIQAAIDVSVDGDTIMVAEGVYASIICTKKVQIIGDGCYDTIIDAQHNGRCALLVEGDEGSPKTNGATVVGFTLRNGRTNDDGVNGAGVYGGILRNCILCDNVGDCYCSGGAADQCLLINCLILNNSTRGNGGACGSCELRNCTVVSNSTSGAGSACYDGRAYNCIFSNNSNFWLKADENNVVLDNPGFVNAENGDYRLAADSPCIDAGNNAYVQGSVDLDGNERILNDTVDIGCYEFDNKIRSIKCKIRTYIDDIDIVHFNNGELWFEHTARQPTGTIYTSLPGRHGGNDYPTYVNGIEWYPDWGTDAERVQVDTETKKIKLVDYCKELLQWPNCTYSLEIVSSRGETTTVESPNVAYSVKMSDPGEGATWYEFEVTIKGPKEEGLVAWYRFDGDAKDSSGYGNDGVVHGATLTMDRFGNENGAYKFDGNDDWIEVAHSSSLGAISNAVALSFWINPKSWWDKSYSDPAIPFVCKASSSYYEGSFRFFVSKRDGNRIAFSGAEDESAYREGDRLCFDIWQHYVIVCNDSGTRVYRNGGLLADSTDMYEIRQLEDVLAIGRDIVGGTTQYLDGSLDDIRLYNRALSAAEVKALYDSGKPHDPFFPMVPEIQPVSGTTFDTSLTISMTCGSEFATIHYTTNGTTPTMESTTYKKFKIYDKTTVKAIAFLEDGTPSEMAVAEYAKGLCEDPIVTPADGTVFEHSGQKVSLTHDNPEGVLRYTIDGSDPTPESPEYTAPFTIDETTVVKAKVFGDQYFDSSIVTATLTRVWLKVATPEVVAETQFTGSKAKVVLACDTEDALIRYTTNGQDPNSHSTKYKGPFYVTDTTTVKAYATKADYTNSDIAALTITKVWGIGDTMGKPDHKFETGGDKGFVCVDDTTATLGESMKSGAIADSEKSILSTELIGPGTLTFKWKASCEEDDEYEWDHGEFRVNGDPKGWINGVTDWIEVSQRIDGEGTNTVTWTYVKDDVEAVEQDCIWVSDYKWASDYTETQTTEVPVPYNWLQEKSRDIVDEYDIYEKVAKQAAYNPRFTVEQCYVAGLDPENATNEFTSAIKMVDGVPVVTWTPDLKTERNYTIWGSETLVDGGSWHSPTNSLDKFFKVTVEMPE